MPTPDALLVIGADFSYLTQQVQEFTSKNLGPLKLNIQGTQQAVTEIQQLQAATKEVTSAINQMQSATAQGSKLNEAAITRQIQLTLKLEQAVRQLQGVRTTGFPDVAAQVQQQLAALENLKAKVAAATSTKELVAYQQQALKLVDIVKLTASEEAKSSQVFVESNKRAQAELQKLTAAMVNWSKQGIKATQDFTTAFNREFSKAIDAATKKQEQLGVQQVQLMRMMADASTGRSGVPKSIALEQLDAALAKNKAGALLTRVEMMKLQDTLGQVADRTSQAAGGFHGLGLNIGKTLLTVTKFTIGFRLMFAVFERINDVIEMDKAMTRLDATLDRSADRGQALRDGYNLIMKGQKDLGLSVKESADVVIELGKALGNNTELMTAAYVPALVLTSQNEGNRAEVVRTLVGIYNIFHSTLGEGLTQQEKYAKISDVMRAASLDTTADVKDLAQAFSLVGPTAKQAGLSLEEATSIIAVVQNTLVKASQSGTGFVRFLQDITTRAPEIARIFKIEVPVLPTGQINTLVFMRDLIAAINREGAGLPATAAKVQEAFKDERGERFVKVFVEAQRELNRLMEVTRNSAGETQRAYETLSSGVSAALGRISAAGLEVVERFMAAVTGTDPGKLAGTAAGLDRIAKSIEGMAKAAEGAATILKFFAFFSPGRQGADIEEFNKRAEADAKAVQKFLDELAITEKDIRTRTEKNQETGRSNFITRFLYGGKDAETAKRELIAEALALRKRLADELAAGEIQGPPMGPHLDLGAQRAFRQQQVAKIIHEMEVAASASNVELPFKIRIANAEEALAAARKQLSLATKDAVDFGMTDTRKSAITGAASDVNRLLNQISQLRKQQAAELERAGKGEDKVLATAQRYQEISDEIIARIRERVAETENLSEASKFAANVGFFQGDELVLGAESMRELIQLQAKFKDEAGNIPLPQVDNYVNAIKEYLVLVAARVNRFHTEQTRQEIEAYSKAHQAFRQMTEEDTALQLEGLQKQVVAMQLFKRQVDEGVVDEQRDAKTAQDIIAKTLGIEKLSNANKALAATMGEVGGMAEAQRLAITVYGKTIEELETQTEGLNQEQIKINQTLAQGLRRYAGLVDAGTVLSLAEQTQKLNRETEFVTRTFGLLGIELAKETAAFDIHKKAYASLTPLEKLQIDLLAKARVEREQAIRLRTLEATGLGHLAAGLIKTNDAYDQEIEHLRAGTAELEKFNRQNEVTTAELLKRQAELQRMNGDGFGFFITSLKQAQAEAGSIWDQIGEAARSTFAGMERSSSDFFFNVMKGNFEDLADVADQFFDSILRTISDFLAQAVVNDLINLFAGLFGMGSRGQAGLFTGGGGGGEGLLATALSIIAGISRSDGGGANGAPGDGFSPYGPYSGGYQFGPAGLLAPTAAYTPGFSVQTILPYIAAATPLLLQGAGMLFNSPGLSSAGGGMGLFGAGRTLLDLYRGGGINALNPFSSQGGPWTASTAGSVFSGVGGLLSIISQLTGNKDIGYAGMGVSAAALIAQIAPSIVQAVAAGITGGIPAFAASIGTSLTSWLTGTSAGAMVGASGASLGAAGPASLLFLVPLLASIFAQAGQAEIIKESITRRQSGSDWQDDALARALAIRNMGDLDVPSADRVFGQFSPRQDVTLLASWAAIAAEQARLAADKYIAEVTPPGQTPTQDTLDYAESLRAAAKANQDFVDLVATIGISPDFQLMNVSPHGVSPGHGISPGDTSVLMAEWTRIIKTLAAGGDPSKVSPGAATSMLQLENVFDTLIKVVEGLKLRVALPPGTRRWEEGGTSGFDLPADLTGEAARAFVEQFRNDILDELAEVPIKLMPLLDLEGLRKKDEEGEPTETLEETKQRVGDALKNLTILLRQMGNEADQLAGSFDFVADLNRTIEDLDESIASVKENASFSPEGTELDPEAIYEYAKQLYDLETARFKANIEAVTKLKDLIEGVATTLGNAAQAYAGLEPVLSRSGISFQGAATMFFDASQAMLVTAESSARLAPTFASQMALVQGGLALFISEITQVSKGLGDRGTLIATAVAARDAIDALGRTANSIEDVNGRVTALQSVMSLTAQTMQQAEAAVKAYFDGLRQKAADLAQSIANAVNIGTSMANTIAGLSRVFQVLEVDISGAAQAVLDFTAGLGSLEVGLAGFQAGGALLNTKIASGGLSALTPGDLSSLGNAYTSALNLAKGMEDPIEKMAALEAILKAGAAVAQEAEAGIRSYYDGLRGAAQEAADADLARVARLRQAAQEAYDRETESFADRREAIQKESQEALDALAERRDAIQEVADLQLEAIDAQREAANEAADAQLEALQDQREAIQDAADRQIDALNIQRDAIQEQLEASREWVRVAKQLRDYVTDLLLGDQAPLNPNDQFLIAQSQYQAAKTRFNVAPTAENADALQTAVQNMLGAAEDVFTRPDPRYVALFEEARATLEAAATFAESQASPTEVLEAQLVGIDATLKEIRTQTEQQIKTIEEQEEAIQDEIKALNKGFDLEEKAIRDALKEELKAFDLEEKTIRDSAEKQIEALEKIEDGRKARFEARMDQLEDVEDKINRDLKTRLAELSRDEVNELTALKNAIAPKLQEVWGLIIENAPKAAEAVRAQADQLRLIKGELELETSYLNIIATEGGRLLRQQQEWLVTAATNAWGTLTNWATQLGMILGPALTIDGFIKKNTDDMVASLNQIKADIGAILEDIGASKLPPVPPAPPAAQGGARQTHEGLYYLHANERVLTPEAAEISRSGGSLSEIPYAGYFPGGAYTTGVPRSRDAEEVRGAQVIFQPGAIQITGVSDPNRAADLVIEKVMRRLKVGDAGLALDRRRRR